MFCRFLFLLTLLIAAAPAAWSFVVIPTARSATAASFLAAAVQEEEQEQQQQDDTSVYKLSLQKPLGIILEENDNGQGVYVKELAETGSALPYAEQLTGAVVAAVMGDTSVQTLPFEAVMEKIIEAPETVDLEFRNVVVNSSVSTKTAAIEEDAYPLGTPVQITMHQYDGEDLWMYPAKVGDNLRTVLQQNGFEVYQGMREKLGNCGGAGQCTFLFVSLLVAVNNN